MALYKHHFNVYFAPAPAYPGGLQENQVVRDKATGAIYRLAGGYKLHYPNMGTYTAHGTPSFTDYDSWMLANIPQGPNIYPPGVSEGQVVRDPASGAIYKLINGKKSHYPDMATYTSHGKPAFTNIDSSILANIESGPNMNAGGIVEGAVVRDKGTGAIYRIMNGHKHHYPNMEIYTAHGKPAYTDYDSHLLSPIPDGASILPPGFYEGQVVRDKSNGAIYRLVGGKKCHYSSMQVYNSHGAPSFADFDPTTLSSIPTGNAF